LQPYW